MREIRALVLMFNRKISGFKKIYSRIIAIKGLGHTLTKVIMQKLNLDPKKKIGEYSQEQLQKIEKEIKEYVFPEFLTNSRKDRRTGESKVLLEIDLNLKKEGDIERLMTIGTYRGVFHQKGEKVRGQRTRSNGRKNKISQIKKKTIAAKKESKPIKKDNQSTKTKTKK
jgi:small subunit ribosomal protein S13